MAEAATTATTSQAPPASGGLPQFDASWWPGEMVWLLAIFLVVFLLMSRVFVPKVGGTIAAREDRISGDIAQARALKEQADVQAAQADAEIAQARGRAQKLAADPRPAEAKVRELYRVAFAREPRPEELKTALAYLAEPRPAGENLQDLLWALLTTKEFLFNH